MSSPIPQQSWGIGSVDVEDAGIEDRIVDPGNRDHKAIGAGDANVDADRLVLDNGVGGGQHRAWDGKIDPGLSTVGTDMQNRSVLDAVNAAQSATKLYAPSRPAPVMPSKCVKTAPGWL